MKIEVVSKHYYHKQKDFEKNSNHKKHYKSYYFGRYFVKCSLSERKYLLKD